MNRKDITKEKIQNFAIAGTLGLILIAVVVVMFLPSVKLKKNEPTAEIINHNLYISKDDGSFSKYNTHSKKYLSELTISTKNEIENKDSFLNPYKIATIGDKFLVTSPGSNELVVAVDKDNKIVEEHRITLTKEPHQIKMFRDTLAISYINSDKVDFYDFKTYKLKNTVSLGHNVDSIELDDKFLYAGAGKYIFMVNEENYLKKDLIKIYTGARTISLHKSNDQFLYAGNIFASDSKNSLLLKIDIENKNVLDILELEKEHPIQMVDNKSDLIVVCKGNADEILDGISVIDKDLFTKKTNISTGDTPNSITLVNSEFAYVSHDSGVVALIDMRDGYSKHSTFNVNAIKAIIYK